jgi:hypothetical protein
LAAALALARKAKFPVVVAKLDRLSSDVHFISGLMAHLVQFIVAELGTDADPSEALEQRRSTAGSDVSRQAGDVMRRSGRHGIAVLTPALGDSGRVQRHS